MKRFLSALVLLISTINLLNAQQRIGFLNSADILQSMPEYKQMTDAVEKKKSEYSKVMESMYADYERKSKEIHEGGDKLNQAVLDSKVSELNDLEKRIQDFEKKAKDDLTKYSESLMKPLNDKYLLAVKSISQANGYSAIINILTGAVAFYTDKTDNITGATMKRLGNQVNSLYSSQILKSNNQKLGHINSIEVLQSMPEFKQMTADLELQKTRYQKILEGKYADYQVKQKELSDLSSIKSTSQTLLDAKIADLQDLQQQIQNFESMVNDDLQKAQQEKLKPINNKYQKVVSEISNANGYSAIIDVVSGGVPFYSEKLNDITGATMKKLGISANGISSQIIDSDNQKFGYINSTEVLQFMPDYKQMTDAVNKKQSEYDKVIGTMYSDYNRKTEELQGASNKFSETVIDSKVLELKDLEKRIQDFEQKSHSDLNKYSEDLMKPINDKYLLAVKNMATRENLAFVFDNASGAFSFLDESLFFNEKLKKELQLSPVENIAPTTTVVTKQSLPLISIKDNHIDYKDLNGNNALDAFEKSFFRFEIKNTGKGDGNNLSVKITSKGSTSGITFSSITKLPVIKAGASYLAEIPLTVNDNIENGSVTFTVKVDEPNGFGSDPVEIEIHTKAFTPPLVKVVDYTVTGDAGKSLTRKQPFDLQVLLQNVKSGNSENVKMEMVLPKEVICLSGNQKSDYPFLKAGETKEVIYSLIVSDNYTANTIPITIQLSEKLGKYAENKNITLNLNQALSTNKITVAAVTENSIPTEIKEASLSSDVDKNIPVTTGSNKSKYALVIGNEDYTKYQTNLGSEVNVAYASSDAKIFASYCEKTLGVPKENITYLENAIGSKMKQEIDRLSKVIQYENGNAEVIFYYAGHGFPDETTKESYIMPVDISGSNVTDGIKLSDLYQKLTANPVKRVSVFLDACFSGGGRNAGLLAARSVKVKPKANAISGNLLVLSASSGEQSSLPYKEKQHGMFTYYLLKKLQETKGDVLYKDLFDYVKQQVELNSIKVNGKDQNPQLNYSSVIENSWSGWKVK